MVSGTKIKLMAMPLMTLGQMTLPMLMSRLMLASRNDEYASVTNPMHSSQRIRIFPTSRPTSMVVKNAATPRGLIA